METNNQHLYPSWLVPIDIGKQLKEIGFDKPCIFSYSEGIGVTACLRSGAGDEPCFSDFVVGGNSPGSPYVDLPAWGQVFEWFREKGLHSRIETYCTNLEPDKKGSEPLKKPVTFYKYCTGKDATGTFFFAAHESNLTSYCSIFRSYEEAQEALVKSLIEEYKRQIDGNK